MSARIAATVAACAAGAAIFLAGSQRAGLCILASTCAMGLMLSVDAEPGGERVALLGLAAAALVLSMLGAVAAVFGFWMGAQQH